MDLTDRKPLVSRYRLKARGFLNSISNRREFEGALIRIDGGFGCIHPWPELGDPTLEKCLADLAGERRWPIVRRALRCAEYDRAARNFEHSLFEEMEIPESHATLAKGNVAEIALAVEAGFTTVKLKAGRDPDAEAKFLDDMAAEFPALRWRLDFNETLAPDAAAGFLLGLAEKHPRRHRLRGRSLPVFGVRMDRAAPRDAGESGRGPRGGSAQRGGAGDGDQAGDR